MQKLQRYCVRGQGQRTGAAVQKRVDESTRTSIVPSIGPTPFHKLLSSTAVDIGLHVYVCKYFVKKFKL